MATKFCLYCRVTKPDEGFKPVFHVKSQTKRMQCPSCQATRKRARQDLELAAAQEGAARRKSISEATVRGKQRALSLRQSGLSNPDIPEREER